MLGFCEAEQTASRCLLLGVAAIVMVGCDSNEGFASGGGIPLTVRRSVA